MAASGIKKPPSSQPAAGLYAAAHSEPPTAEDAAAPGPSPAPLRKRRVVLVKRTLDLIGSSLLILLFSPLYLLIPLLIKLDSRGPVFYVQNRLGPAGSTIPHFKYRTMARDAEGQLADLLRKDPGVRREFEAFHKIADDPRLTRTGRFLRKHSLDEIPQLWQVLRGQLSLVGPRAYLIEELEEMGAYAEAILQFRPGLTGWWQVNGRNAVTFQERLALDLYYLQHWSLRMELSILVKTIYVVLTGQGA